MAGGVALEPHASRPPVVSRKVASKCGALNVSARFLFRGVAAGTRFQLLRVKRARRRSITRVHFKH